MKYLKKLFSTLVTIFITSIIIFLIFEMIPGDPVLARMGIESDPIVEAQLRAQFGLDSPLYIRFFKWITQVFQGNLGYSFSYSNYTVTELILSRVNSTIFIALTTLVITIVLSIPLGITLAKNRDKGIFRFLKIFTQVGFSLPSFWISIILMYILSLKLHLFPTIGSYALPILTLSLVKTPLVAHYLSNNMIEESHKDYVRVAKSKGLSKNKIYLNHILRNSLITVVTITGMITISLVTGTIVVENVFSIPGLGTLLLEAINRKDYPLVQGIVLYISFAIAFINFLVDATYNIIDPRTRNGGN